MLVFEKRENHSTLTDLDQAYQLLKATAVFSGIKISRTCNICISTFYIFMVVFFIQIVQLYTVCSSE